MANSPDEYYQTQLKNVTADIAAVKEIVIAEAMQNAEVLQLSPTQVGIKAFAELKGGLRNYLTELEAEKKDYLELLKGNSKQPPNMNTASKVAVVDVELVTPSVTQLVVNIPINISLKAFLNVIESNCNKRYELLFYDDDDGDRVEIDEDDALEYFLQSGGRKQVICAEADGCKEHSTATVDVELIAAGNSRKTISVPPYITLSAILDVIEINCGTRFELLYFLDTEGDGIEIDDDECLKMFFQQINCKKLQLVCTMPSSSGDPPF
eukprot:TRINITY_DN3059_c0_g1_i4.p1 TRINITY_DN3059_c0_g1~~TRINITY_DN3059_c0_g1_i4.p1  ORF type:complete len:266 (+),score=61.00 TRINITY_DN3059_c0_g1_i4:59-856(+)